MWVVKKSFPLSLLLGIFLNFIWILENCAQSNISSLSYCRNQNELNHGSKREFIYNQILSISIYLYQLKYWWGYYCEWLHSYVETFTQPIKWQLGICQIHGKKLTLFYGDIYMNRTFYFVSPHSTAAIGSTILSIPDFFIYTQCSVICKMLLGFLLPSITIF